MSLSITSGWRRRRAHWGKLKLMIVELIQMTRGTVRSLTLTAPSRNISRKMKDGLPGWMMKELIYLTKTAGLFPALALVPLPSTAVIPENSGSHRVSAQLAGTSTRRQKKWKHLLKINWTMVSGRIVGGKSVNFLQNSCESVPLQTCHSYMFSLLLCDVYKIQTLWHVTSGFFSRKGGQRG